MIEATKDDALGATKRLLEFLLKDIQWQPQSSSRRYVTQVLAMVNEGMEETDASAVVPFPADPAALRRFATKYEARTRRELRDAGLLPDGDLPCGPAWLCRNAAAEIDRLRLANAAINGDVPGSPNVVFLRTLLDMCATPAVRAALYDESGDSNAVDFNLDTLAAMTTDLEGCYVADNAVAA